MIRTRLARFEVLLALAPVALAACGSSDGPAPTREHAPTVAKPAPSSSNENANGTAPSATPTSSTAPTAPAPPSDPFTHTLTVYAIHAPRSSANPTGLVWESPGGLARQVLYNGAGEGIGVFKHSIGHATVHVSCAAEGGRPAAEVMTGMTSADDSSLNNLVLNDGVGLGVMFERVPGRLQTAIEVRADIEDGKTTGNTNFVRFGIRGDVCHALLDYVGEYRARGVDAYYGLDVHPLKAEGAGCSAFVVSFLELAGLVDASIAQAWSFHVRVPLYTDPWIGSPTPIVGGVKNPGVQVPVTRVASLTRGWATPQEQGFDIAGWDPTQMNEWIDAEIDRALASGSAKVEITGKLRGLLLDRTGSTPSAPLMNGTFFTP